MNKPAKKRRERIYLEVIKGGFRPADACAAAQLRARGYRMGDILAADLSKLRNQKFNRLVHRIGQLVVANVEAFAGIETHRAIKRLQLESGAHCEELAIMIDGYGMVTQRVPLSLSFENTDEAEFHAAAKTICRHISAKYWPTLSPEQVEEMAEMMVEE